MKAYLTVGEMGRMFGLNVQTLHYYDKIGLFCPQLPKSGDRAAGISLTRSISWPPSATCAENWPSAGGCRVLPQFPPPVHTMDLLRERSALRAQWQELMRIDEAILRKLSLWRKSRSTSSGTEYVRYPSRAAVHPHWQRGDPVYEGLLLFLSYHRLRGKSEIFWCVCGRAPDMGGEEEELPEESQATSPFQRETIWWPFIRAATMIPQHIAQMRRENADLNLGVPLTVTFNIIDQFVEK